MAGIAAGRKVQNPGSISLLLSSGFRRGGSFIPFPPAPALCFLYAPHFSLLLAYPDCVIAYSLVGSGSDAEWDLHGEGRRLLVRGDPLRDADAEAIFRGGAILQQDGAEDHRRRAAGAATMLSRGRSTRPLLLGWRCLPAALICSSHQAGQCHNGVHIGSWVVVQVLLMMVMVMMTMSSLNTGCTFPKTPTTTERMPPKSTATGNTCWAGLLLNNLNNLITIDELKNVH